MPYQRKTRDVWELWTNYGWGWENESSYYERKACRRDVKAYRENCPGVQIKVKKTREKIKQTS